MAAEGGGSRAACGARAVSAPTTVAADARLRAARSVVLAVSESGGEGCVRDEGTVVWRGVCRYCRRGGML